MTLNNADIQQAKYHSDALKEMARNEKAQYKKRALFDAASFLDALTPEWDDEKPVTDE